MYSSQKQSQVLTTRRRREYGHFTAGCLEETRPHLLCQSRTSTILEQWGVDRRSAGDVATSRESTRRQQNGPLPAAADREDRHQNQNPAGETLQAQKCPDSDGADGHCSAGMKKEECSSLVSR
ncbi:hypothetical protein EYF80_059514 [Liparis tanakae]|uniref:Uncharacterized protein n=1 Tax=Liparis tanakae TaxID=230148 RepID=A0A4Z2EN67_9TELE|nr:hypothetical protein EYF80_059514 [Liparis tanakae]